MIKTAKEIKLFLSFGLILRTEVKNNEIIRIHATIII
jgi:hypothetical protein